MKNLGNRQPATDNGQNIDDLLQDLSRMLDVVPSPEFGARVLATVQRPTRESLLWSWRWGFAAGALVTVVLLTIVTQMNSRTLITRPPDASAKQTVEVPAIEPVATEPPAARRVRASQILHEPMTIAASAARRAPRTPQVLIAPDQAAAVRTLLDRFARGNAPSTVVSKDTAEPALQELAIDELAPIPLIVISPLDAPPNAGGAGSKK